MSTEKKERPTFEFHFHGNVGQQIANVERMEVRFDKDMNMQISNVEKSPNHPSPSPFPSSSSPSTEKPTKTAKEPTPEATGRSTSMEEHQQNQQRERDRLRAEMMQHIYDEIKSLLEWDEIKMVLHTDYSIEDVLGIYDAILSGTSEDYRLEQGQIQEMLSSDNSQYRSNELNLMGFMQTVGFYMSEGMWTKSPIKMARLIFPKFEEKDIENMRLYIQRGKNCMTTKQSEYLKSLM